jgi:hypothetical protein
MIAHKCHYFLFGGLMLDERPNGPGVIGPVAGGILARLFDSPSQHADRLVSPAIRAYLPNPCLLKVADSQAPIVADSERPLLITDAAITTPQAAVIMLAPIRWYGDGNDRNEVTRRVLMQVLAI